MIKMIDRINLLLILLLLFKTDNIFTTDSDSPGLIDWFNNKTNFETYHRWVRPSSRPCAWKKDKGTPKDYGPLIVNISVDLYNYATVNEITSEYTFHLFVDFEWMDCRLATDNPSEEYTIEGGEYHINRLWYPQVFVTNNQDPGSFDSENHSASLIMVKSDGYVWMRKRKMLHLNCDMDFRQYPFDQQDCAVIFESSIYTNNDIILKWHSQIPVQEAESFRAVGFHFVKNETKSSLKTYSKNNSFSRVSLVFTLEREWAHYLFMFYMPTGLIVVTSWASFWLEITSPPARVSMGVTTMLALVTSFKSTKSQLPSVSYWNALDIWNMVCIIFIFASLMEFACVNYIFNTEKRRRKNKKLKKKLEKRRSFEKIGIISRMSSVSTLESIFTMSSIDDINRRRSEQFYEERRLSTKSNETSRRSSTVGSTLGSTVDQFKRRRSTIITFEGKLMPNIVEESCNSSSRRGSNISARNGSASRRQSVAQQQKIIEKAYKLTPQELANEIDRMSRRIFPLLFFIFNILYWSILKVNFLF